MKKFVVTNSYTSITFGDLNEAMEYLKYSGIKSGIIKVKHNNKLDEIWFDEDIKVEDTLAKLIEYAAEYSKYDVEIRLVPNNAATISFANSQNAEVYLVVTSSIDLILNSDYNKLINYSIKYIDGRIIKFIHDKIFTNDIDIIYNVTNKSHIFYNAENKKQVFKVMNVLNRYFNGHESFQEIVLDKYIEIKDIMIISKDLLLNKIDEFISEYKRFKALLGAISYYSRYIFNQDDISITKEYKEVLPYIPIHTDIDRKYIVIENEDDLQNIKSYINMKFLEEKL